MNTPLYCNLTHQHHLKLYCHHHWHDEQAKSLMGPFVGLRKVSLSVRTKKNCKKCPKMLWIGMGGDTIRHCFDTKNIARGTTDPGYWVQNLSNPLWAEWFQSNFGQKMIPLNLGLENQDINEAIVGTTAPPLCSSKGGTAHGEQERNFKLVIRGQKRKEPNGHSSGKWRKVTTTNTCLSQKATVWCEYWNYSDVVELVAVLCSQ